MFSKVRVNNTIFLKNENSTMSYGIIISLVIGGVIGILIGILIRSFFVEGFQSTADTPGPVSGPVPGPAVSEPVSGVVSGAISGPIPGPVSGPDSGSPYGSGSGSTLGSEMDKIFQDLSGSAPPPIPKDIASQIPDICNLLDKLGKDSLEKINKTFNDEGILSSLGGTDKKTIDEAVANARIFHENVMLQRKKEFGCLR
jgi:hypothetical protein